MLKYRPLGFIFLICNSVFSEWMLYLIQFQVKSILKLNVERMNSIADVVSQMRQMAGVTTATSPVDAPPSDPDVWPLPPLTKKTSAIPSPKGTNKKQTSSRVSNKTKKGVVGKSTYVSAGGRNIIKRDASLGHASMNELSEVTAKEEGDNNSNVGILPYLICC